MRCRARLRQCRAVGEARADDGDRDRASSTGASVPTISPSRSGVLPWLKMITASAPAACALTRLVTRTCMCRAG